MHFPVNYFITDVIMMKLPNGYHTHLVELELHDCKYMYSCILLDHYKSHNIIVYMWLDLFWEALRDFLHKLPFPPFTRIPFPIPCFSSYSS